MEIFASTARLILREMIPADAPGMFALDSDAAVQRYVGNQPIRSMAEAREKIAYIRQQYQELGIGRWAVIEKASNTFVGWAGLKLVKEPMNNYTDYYDLGYRFIKDYWGKGYATECAVASLEYGFGRMKLETIYAWADAGNQASCHVLEKAGLKMTETFYHDGVLHHWFKISREDWEQRR